MRALIRSALNLPRHGQLQRTDSTAAVESPVLVGNSPQMQLAQSMIEKLARTQAPVHVTGESGSGKELAARRIHYNGARKDGPFVAVNCGAVPETLMESEFFGYKKGAFTGAASDRDGFFQASNGGTLFLDEVADLPLLMQVKLLRAIQEKRVRKVGSPSEENVDVRIISATHRNLADEVENGLFRQDLFYRLNVIELRMPALREMREDISLMATAILKRQVEPLGVGAPRLSLGALKTLETYDFPGNVRELENILERALALTKDDEIKAEDLRLSPKREDLPDVSGLPLPERLEKIERQAIMAALEKTRYNRTAAAKLLGVSFRALRYRIERLGIKDELDTKR